MGMGKRSKIKQYSDTMDQLIQQALEKRERATKLAGTTKRSIEDAKRLGIDTTRASGLLQKAQGILGDIQEMSQYDEVLKLLSEANNMATLAKNQFLQADQLLKSARNTVTEISKDGINIDPPKELLSKAEIAFKNRQYASVKDLANRCISDAKIRKQNYFKASKLIKDAISKIHTAKSRNLDTKDAEKFLDDATNMMANNAYKTAITIAQKSIVSSENAQPMVKPKPAPPPVSAPSPAPAPAPAPTPKSSSSTPSGAAKKPYITLEYPGTRTFKSGTWSKLELEITNEGTAPAIDIELKLSDDVDSRGVRAIHRIKPGEKKTVGVGIRTERRNGFSRYDLDRYR
jgi:hypothetical protein